MVSEVRLYVGCICWWLISRRFPPAGAMRSRLLGALLVMLSVGLTASAQTQDQLQALKDTLSPDSQSSILQGVLGKGDGTGKKTDNKRQNAGNSLADRRDEGFYPQDPEDPRWAHIAPVRRGPRAAQRRYRHDRDDPAGGYLNRIGAPPAGQINNGNNLNPGTGANNLSGD